MGKGEVWRESLGEGRGQTRGGTAPLLSLLIPGAGTPPPAGGASGWRWRGAAQNFQGQALPFGRVHVPPQKWTRPEVPPLPRLTAMPTGWQRSPCPI